LKEQILDKVPKIFEAVFQVYTEFSWMSYWLSINRWHLGW
jgi:hypothetical protein